MKRKGYFIACFLCACFLFNGCSHKTSKTVAPVDNMVTNGPTYESTIEPTKEPVNESTSEPTSEPLDEPTSEPTKEPTDEPTTEPVGDSTSEQITNETQAKTEAELLIDQYLEISKEESYFFDTVKEEELQLLHSSKTTSKEFKKFEGTWNRTNCMNSYSGVLTISDVKEDSFQASAGLSFYSHSGVLLQTEGYFISDTKAVIEYNGIEEYPTCLILLVFEGDNLQVIGIGEEFGFGANVRIDGTYTQNEVHYLNENQLNDNFTESEQNKMKALLSKEGYDYIDLFETPVQYGIIDTMSATAVFEDGTEKAGKFYSCFIPTMGGYDFELFLSKDGFAYWKQSEKTFLTDDWNTTTMPEIKYN